MFRSAVLALCFGGVAAFAPARPAWTRAPVKLFGEGEYGASGTSFYTTTEKQDSYDSLDSVLKAKCKDEKTRAVILEMLDACADITEALRSALVTVEGSANTFGDAQLSVDVIADELMWETCKKSKVVAYGASEEEPEIKACNPDGEFTVCWDPLDGSSIVDNNWAVGTMIGIWGSKSGSGDDGLIGATGRDQVTSLVALYGPRTTVLVALEDGVYEFSYGCTPEGCELPDGTFEPWICSRSQIKISEDCKIFSPANMRAAQDVPGYKKLLDHYMENKFTLRYSGGLVPDVYVDNMRACAPILKAIRVLEDSSCARAGTSSSPRTRACSPTRRARAAPLSFASLLRRHRGDFSSKRRVARRATARRVARFLTWRSLPSISAPLFASARATRSIASMT